VCLCMFMSVYVYPYVNIKRVSGVQQDYDICYVQSRPKIHTENTEHTFHPYTSAKKQASGLTPSSTMASAMCSHIQIYTHKTHNAQTFYTHTSAMKRASGVTPSSTVASAMCSHIQIYTHKKNIRANIPHIYLGNETSVRGDSQQDNGFCNEPVVIWPEAAHLLDRILHQCLHKLQQHEVSSTHDQQAMSRSSVCPSSCTSCGNTKRAAHTHTLTQ